MAWTVEKTDELIQLYEARPCLYNTKSKDYFNRDMRQKAVEEIALALEVSESVVRTKLKNIRTQYTREKQKSTKRKSGQGADETYISKWVHFEKLKFLDDYVVPKSSTSNLKITPDNETEVGEAEEESIELVEETPSDEIKSTKRPLQTSTKKLTKRQKIQAQEEDLMKKAISCIENATHTPSTPGSEVKKDEYDLFGQYIAAELRAMDSAHARRWAKLQIQTVLYDSTSARSPSPMPWFQSPYGRPYGPATSPSGSSHTTAEDHYANRFHPGFDDV